MNSATHVAEFTYRRAVSCLARGSTSFTPDDLSYDEENGKYYFEVELRAYEFNQTLQVSAAGDLLFFNLADYYARIDTLTIDNKDELKALVEALNTYAEAAKAYNLK